MKRFFGVFVTLVLMGIGSADADQIACKIDGDRPVYDPEFCKAIQISREALDLNWKLLKKAGETRLMIDRHLQQQLKEHEKRPR